MADLYDAAIQRVAKWRAVFAGWQLGTRAKGDPESDAVRDHREVTILLRCESNALARLCIEKGVFTAEEFTRAIAEEAEILNAAYEKKFPGFTASEAGITIDTHIAKTTMKGWRP